MIDKSIKQIIFEMSPEALEQILNVIRSRKDIAAVFVTTQKEVDEMDVYYKGHFEELYGLKKEVVNEPA